jgi:hypothetical protein
MPWFLEQQECRSGERCVREATNGHAYLAGDRLCLIMDGGTAIGAEVTPYPPARVRGARKLLADALNGLDLVTTKNAFAPIVLPVRL